MKSQSHKQNPKAMTAIPLKPSVEDIRRVAENARRLHRDAHYLLADHRYRSAFALTILALEEVGKIIQAIRPQRLSPQAKAKSLHLEKQRALSLLLLMAGIVGLRNGKLSFNTKGQLISCHNGLEKVIFDLTKSKTYGSNANANLTKEQKRQRIMQFVEASPEDNSVASHELEALVEMVQPLSKGKFNSMKNSAFYEDFRDSTQENFQNLTPILVKSSDTIFDMLDELSP